MSAWSRISRDDLITWANSDGAKELPELVRRLVYETGDGIDAIDMPGGSGIALGGYDGFVRATNGTAFIPHGVSVWELSVRKGAPAKADEDYAKRVEVPDGSPTAQATYIQLICRPWAKAQAWAKDRASDGRWREVRAYDVDVLTTWLEQAPATRLWFLELRGRSPTGVTPASTWWARWSGETEPALAADVVLARSKAGLDGLHAALRRPGVTTISGPMGADELTACTVAAAVGADDDLLSRTLIVHDQATWSRLLADPAPMVLIAGDGSFAKLVDPTTHHTVVIPVPHSAEGDVELDLIDGDVVANALRAADHSLPNELGALARRSLVALRRRLAKQHVVRPTWATAPPSRAVRAATLLVSWDDRSEADRAVLSVLAGMPYEEARERLLALTHGDDPLLALTGSYWHVVSPLDAWLLLGRYLLVDDLTVFVGQATGVLGERDPSLSMPPGDRWRANLDGKVRAYSGAVRKGVVTTLALLGAYGETVGIGSGVHGEVWAARAIRPQLDAANADVAGELWASMADVLPLLIEASPRDVLDAMRKGTTGLNPVLSTIFQDDPDQQSLFGPSSPHTWFLWALERAAWSGEHLAATSELLARLAVLDPGGRLSKRPQASLESIYCGWHPDTAADPAARLVVIDRLRERWPETAWSLLISLLPVSHGIHHPTNDPEFRDWKPHQRAVLLSEYRHLIDAVVGRLLEDVGADVARWNDLLGAHQNLPPDLREGVRETLDSVDLSGLGDDVRRALWNRVRKLAAHHREYADAKWAMSEDELSLLDAIAERIAPADPEHRHAWLFADDWIELGDLRRQDDFAAYRAEVAARRAAAMNEIVSADPRVQA